MARPVKLHTGPCEYCGTILTRTGKEAAGHKHWTCGASCSAKLRIQRGAVAPSWQTNRFRGQRETRPCGQCGRPITRYVTEENHDRPWFCSREHGAEALNATPRKGKGDLFPCATCGTPFYRMPKEITRNRLYCSYICAQAGRHVQTVRKNCRHCGKEMVLRPSETYHIYCSRKCDYEHRITQVVPDGRTHNGKPVRLMSDGYVKLWEPTHPRANKGWIPEHIYVMERHLGRPITRDEEVDHKDGVRSHNDVANLQVLTKAEHRKKTWEDRREEQLRLRAEDALARRLEREREELQHQIAEKEAELAALRAQAGVR